MLTSSWLKSKSDLKVQIFRLSQGVTVQRVHISNFELPTKINWNRALDLFLLLLLKPCRKSSRWSFGNYFTSLHCNYLVSIRKEGRSDLYLIRISMFWLRKPRQAAMLCLQFRDTSKFIFLETDNDFWGKKLLTYTYTLF